MSDVVRRFRIQNAPYRKGATTMDGRVNPFRLPSMVPFKKQDEPRVEGVPPVVPQIKRHTT